MTDDAVDARVTSMAVLARRVVREMEAGRARQAGVARARLRVYAKRLAADLGMVVTEKERGFGR